MKKIISITLVLVMLLSMLVACGDETLTLAAPANVKCSETGLITWDAVNGATSYIVTVADKTYTVNTNSYQVTNVGVDFRYSVVACAEGAENSPASAEGVFTADRTPAVDPEKITVSVTGATEVRTGHSVTLKATVAGTENAVVWWEVVEGGEYVTVNEETGEVTAKSGLTADAKVVVAAHSFEDEEAIGTRALTVVGRPTLTQAMLDEIGNQTKLEFSGYVDIDLYKFGLINDFYRSETAVISAATDGEYWYAEYVNGNTGLSENIYYKNNNGIACQVGVSFNNTEEYYPMLNDFGREVTWENAGLYNNFKGLKVADFEFEEEGWRFVYCGDDATLMGRVVACANPYDFIPVDLGLMIGDDGTIVGVTSKAKDDYTIVQGYRAEQTMIVTLNYGDTVEVKRIGKFAHEDWHDGLTAAIQNMQNLNSYKMQYLESSTSYYTGYAYSGFTETITEDLCYFDPFTMTQNAQQEFVAIPTGLPYGYKQVREDLYNSFYYNRETSAFAASRAYSGSVNQAKPTFNFAAEIFTYHNVEEDGSITYFVNEAMKPVASTFYYGVGNDIQLYGIFADIGYVNGSAFTPFVTVKDNMIVSAGFFFNLGEIYGTVMIEYSEFDTATAPAEEPTFPTREVPAQWSDLLIIDDGEDMDSTSDDVEMPADQFINTFFGDDTAATELPFFGDYLGDTFGFGMTQRRFAPGASVSSNTIVLYYDVPLDDNYGITSYIEGLQRMLVSAGYTKTAGGEYQKGNIIVSPMDVSLDLIIYVYKA